MSETTKNHPHLKAFLVVSALMVAAVVLLIAAIATQDSPDESRFYNDPDLTRSEIDAGFNALASRLPAPGGDSMGVAKALCDWFDETGASFWQGVSQMKSEYPVFTTRDQAVQFTDLATSAYCPQHARS